MAVPSAVGGATEAEGVSSGATAVEVSLDLRAHGQGRIGGIRGGVRAGSTVSVGVGEPSGVNSTGIIMKSIVGGVRMLTVTVSSEVEALAAVTTARLVLSHRGGRGIDSSSRRQHPRLSLVQVPEGAEAGRSDPVEAVSQIVRDRHREGRAWAVVDDRDEELHLFTRRGQSGMASLLTVRSGWLIPMVTVATFDGAPSLSQTW